MSRSAELLRGAGESIAVAGLSVFGGYSLSAYRQQLWPKVAEEFEPIFIHQLDEGDPSASPIPRFWTKLGLLSCQTTVLADMKEKYPEAQDAVCYKDARTGVCRAAILRGDCQFTLGGDDNELRLIYMRIGGGPLIATLGVQEPGEPFMGLPTQLQAIATKAELAATAPQAYII